MNKKLSSHPANKTNDNSPTRGNMKTNGSWPILREELHAKILEGLSNHQLAQQFKVSPRTIGNWKRTLKKELMSQEDFNKFTWVSDQIASLKVLKAKAFANFLEATESGNGKEAYKWCEAALKAQKALNDLFISSGALDDMPLAPETLKRTGEG